MKERWWRWAAASPRATDAIETVASLAVRHEERHGVDPFRAGRCTVCGKRTLFFASRRDEYRESLLCAECGATSRYRSLARGLLRAFAELAGIRAESLAGLPKRIDGRPLSVYDTQVPFRFERVGYILPDLLAECRWIDIHLSSYKPDRPWGAALGPRTTNQTLEALTYASGSFNIVVTSDVMEHVRLADRAHREIRRVLSPGGIYLFTVPHFRHGTTIRRVEIVDSERPELDRHLLPPEYHGDANGPTGEALAYRAYGLDLDAELEGLGFDVDYRRDDIAAEAIHDAELFYCRVVR